MEKKLDSMINSMLDRALAERMHKAYIENPRHDRNVYEDVDALYQKRKEEAGKQMGKVKREQNKYGTSEEVQSSIFRDEFYDEGHPIPESMRVTDIDRDQILEGLKRRPDPNQYLEPKSQKKQYRDLPYQFNDTGSAIDDKKLKKMILNKLKKINDEGGELKEYEGGKKTKVRRRRKAYDGNNPWIEHVKNMAKELGLTYKQAIQDPRVKESYK